MAEVANLNIKADATSVDAAKSSLSGLKNEARETGSAIRDMAEKINATESALRSEYQAARQSATAHLEASKATQQATTATQANANAVRMSAEEYKKLTAAKSAHTSATLSATKAEQDIITAMQAGRNVTAEQIKAVGGLSNAMKVMEGAHQSGAKAVGTLAREAAGAEKAITGSRISTSLFVRELLVLGREAGRGDFTRMAGSATLLAQSAGLLSLLMTPLGLTIGAVTLATVGFAAAMLAGQKEASKFQGSLIATGNYAGFTADSFEEMAHRIAKSQDEGIRSVRGGIAELAGSGKYTADTIALMVENAERYAKITGKSADDIVKDYETMKGGVVKWAVKHEEVFHDLTLAQIDYIDKLEKMGLHHEAELKVMEDINKSVKDRTIPQFGMLQRMLHDVATTASDMWDKILGIGRPKTLGDKINDAQAQLNGLNTPYNTHEGNTASVQIKRKAAQQLVDDLKYQQAVEATDALVASQKAQIEDDKIRKKYDNQGFHANRQPKVDKVAEKQESIQAQIDGNRLLADAYDLSTAAGFKAAAMKKALADAAVTNGKASDFEQLEITAAVTKTIADGEKQAALLEQKNQLGATANAMMRDTGVSQQIANQAVKDAVDIAGLQAAADNATGADKAKALDLIIRTKNAQKEANAVSREAWMVQSETNLKESNDELNVELGLVNATNRERAVAIAQMRAENELKKNGEDPRSARGTAYIAGKKAEANKKEDLASGVGDAIKQGKFYLELQDEMISRTKDAAASMADSFGKVGTAISALTAVFADHYSAATRMDLDYAQRRKDANGDQEKLNALEKSELSAKRDSNLQYYGDVAGAAASFFNKHTAAYKVLHAAEMGFRAFQMASSIASMIQSTIETGHTVATNAVKTASNVAAGGSKMFSQLGIYAFPLVAAMIAVMAGLGSGGGGAGAAAPAPNSDAVQKGQGAGSVLGDDATKSASISNSLKVAANNSVKYLETSNRMLDVLKSIDSHISVLAGAIARTMHVSGGMFDTSGLNLGTSGSKGFLGIGGSSTTRSLSDLGIKFNSQTLGDILSGGVSGQTYQQVMATKTSNGVFGIGGGTKTSTSTSYGNIDGDVSSAIQDTLRALRDGIVEGAKILGVTGADEILKSFTLAIGSVSFANMTGAEIQDSLNAIFSKVGDDMAGAVVPGLKTMQKVNEGLMETLVRVAREYQVVDLQLATIGKTFSKVGIESVVLRDRLVQLFGGLDQFQSATDFFQENFLTDAEKLAPVQALVAKQMSSLGLSAIQTKDQFKQLVLGIDLTTEGGQDLFHSLMNIAPAFDKVTQAANDNVTALQQNVKDRTSGLIGAYTAESKAIQDVISRTTKWIDTLKKYKQALGISDAAGLSPQDQYSATKQLFQSTLSKAVSGDPDARDQLQSVSDSFLTASRNYFASSKEYFSDFSDVNAGLDRVIAVLGGEQNDATRQQQALDDMVNEFSVANGLLTRVAAGVDITNQGVTSVADAISALASAIGAAQAAQEAQTASAQAAAQATIAAALAAANQPPTATSTPTATPNDPTPASLSDRENNYLQRYPDVAKEAMRVTNSGEFSSTQNYAQWHYQNYGQPEGRMFATGGAGVVSGTGGTDSKRIQFRATPGELVSVHTPGQLQQAANFNDRTEKLLSKMVDLLEGAGQQRADAHQEAMDLAKRQLSEAAAAKRAARTRKMA